METPFGEPTRITLEEAISVCREIEERLKPIGYHCGLTGSTLYKGESFKDIDIIVYPHQVSDTKTLDEIIIASGVTTNMYQSQGNLKPLQVTPSTTDKLVLVGGYNGYRIDLFVLQ